MKNSLTAFVLSVSIGLAGCDEARQARAGNDYYRVTASEAFVHHYVRGQFPETPACMNVQRCDLPEIRITFIHGEVKTVATCQSWDENNDCSLLRVGQYSCEHNEHPEKYGNMLRCDPKKDTSWSASLDIEKEEVAK